MIIMGCSMCTLMPTILVILVCYKLFKSLLFPKTYVTDWSNKYVLITGCDSGFGRAIAVKLDQLDLHVFAACLTEEGAASLREECSDRVKTLMLDVTSSDQIRRAYGEVKRLLPPNTALWGLVNNAGIGPKSPVEWMPLADYKKIADVNLWGVIDITKTFLPLIKQARGRVVQISSVAGRITLPTYAGYSLSKYAMEAFSDALRREMHPFGVKVTIVEPGGFTTNLTGENGLSKFVEGYWDKLGDNMKEEYGEEYLKKVARALNTFTKRFPSDLSPVMNALVDGLLLVSPPVRRVVGGPYFRVLALLSMLPDWLVDNLLWRSLSFVPKSALEATYNSNDKLNGRSNKTLATL